MERRTASSSGIPYGEENTAEAADEGASGPAPLPVDAFAANGGDVLADVLGPPRGVIRWLPG